MKKLIIILLTVLMVTTIIFGAESSFAARRLAKTTAIQDIWMDANRMHAAMRNNGIWMRNMILSNEGLYWPRGTNLSPMFSAGQWVGARVNETARVAGVVHGSSDFHPGEITQWGIDPPVAGNRLDPRYRFYELRSDGRGDWDDWPVEMGAPLDADGNPALIGDQLIWCVYNDMGERAQFNTPKLGVEIRQSVWAFDRADAIGDMMFFKWQMTNKSAYDWDETYFVIWTDPDVGDGWDDFVGCDTTQGLGYAYNANDDDQTYGSAPPAIGIDFFQGPIIDSPGETVTLPNGSVLTDKKMLKMTSFIYYNNNDSPQGDPQTGSDAWNYMRGIWRDGTPITYGGTGTDPNSTPTRFMFTGDPESQTGWLDDHTTDRRFMMATGPFMMEKWVDSNGNNIPDFGEPGVQEIVAGVLVGRGSDNLNSVTYLKAIDEIAQLAYDLDFALPRPPKTPDLQASTTSNTVILTWGSRSEFMDDGVTAYSVTDIVADGLVGQKMVVNGEYTDVTDGTYDFTGYTVYQYSNASGGDPVIYQRLGVETIADATPYGGARFLRVTMNRNPVVGPVGDPLRNGKEYYFGITANSYCKFAIPQNFTSPAAIVTAVPQNHPGERYYTAEGDTVIVSYEAVNPNQPAGDGSVIVTIVDPSAVTGHDYRVTFKEDANGDVTWDLNDETLGTIVLADQTNQAGDEAYTIVDGLFVQVAGPPPGIKEIVELDPATGEVFDANLWGSLNNYGRSQHWPTIVISENAGTDYTRMDRFSSMSPKDYEIIFNDTDQTLAWDYSTDAVLKDTLTGDPEYLPLTCWRIDLDGTRTRLPVTVLDNDGDGNWNRSVEGVYGPAFELLYIYDNAEYNPADAASYIAADDGTAAPGYGPWGVSYPAINRFCINMYQDVDGYAIASDLDGDGFFWGPPHAGEYIRINTNKPNTANDVFLFTAPQAKSLTEADRKNDLDMIRVVPNPYYGYHTGEVSIFDRWVQFTCLPEACRIRIFDLAGEVVRVLDKDDPTSTFLRWDLNNEYGLPVASGIYIYHVDVPGVGSSIGKLAVFAPNERLDTF